MPCAEALGCTDAEAGSSSHLFSGPGYVISEFDDSFLEGIGNRIALTHRIGRHLGSFDIDDVDRMQDISIPEGTFSIRAKRFEGMMRSVDTQDLVRKLGASLSVTNDVDLVHPDIEVRMLLSDKVHVFISEYTVDRESMESRKVGERPFFSPISLHPRYARAAINLTRVKRGGTVLDPFCGTGGILIEAAMMGMKAIASDFDEDMVEGCRENMDHFGLELHDGATLDIGDVPASFSNIDSIVTDPPYGRSTHTGGEDVASIHRRAIDSVGRTLKGGGRACIVLPYEIGPGGMVREDVFVQRVHGSLSRHYHVFMR